MLTHPQPFGAPANAATSREFVGALASSAAAATRQLAAWCIDEADLVLRLKLCADLHEDAVLTQRLIHRCTELGLHADPCHGMAASGHFTAAAGATTTKARLGALYGGAKAQTLAAIDAFVLDPVADAPSAWLLTDVQRIWRDQIASWGAARVSPLPVGPAPTITRPPHPARDPRLTYVPGGEEAGEDVALMHRNLTELELATIEVCAAAILDFPEMPWAFVVDMARQVWDEARHAALFWRGLEARGGHLGICPSSHDLWHLTMGRPLKMRLAIHQCIGEWIGVGGAFFHADRLAAAGDADGAALFAFVGADEVNHVAIGNRWVDHLVPDPEDRLRLLDEARGHRRDAGRSTDRPPVFPFRRDPCRRAGFPDAEIDRLEAIYRTEGSRFPPCPSPSQRNGIP